MKNFLGAFALAATLSLSSLACSNREPIWGTRNELLAHGLDGSAALIDASAERALLLPVEGDLSLSPVSVPIGRGYASSAVSPDGSRLFVLTRGDQPRRRATDQEPRLTVIGGGITPSREHDYTLGDPLSGLAIDPLGDFAVAYPSAADEAFVQNPNELSIVDLHQGQTASNPAPITLRSFGGRPRALTFTKALELPGGARRLLVVATDRDLGVLELAHPELGDITVRLTSTGAVVTPAQIAITDGEPGRDDDARIAIRLEGESNVVLVDLIASDGTTAHDFRPTPNLVFAGGTPSDVAFVRTDGGLRLAALVPSQKSLTLIDPATGISSAIDLGTAFDKLAIVTDQVGGDSGADVALLWSSSSPEVAFVALGQTIGKPYKSIERLTLESPVTDVLDVPPPNDRLKVLASRSGGFVVLDLAARTASPIVSQAYEATLSVSSTGQRAWITAPQEPAIAALNLGDLHPRNLVLDAPVAFAFEVARRDGGRALIALHHESGVSATVLDGTHPSLETAIDYQGLLLGGFQ
jgi:hypothetical protein